MRQVSGIDFDGFFGHNYSMGIEKRKSVRYNVLGRVQCNELSPLSGSLIDISQNGCQIYYTVPVSVHLEDEYTLFIKTSDSQDEGLSLLCRPMWVNEDSGKTFLGMSVLRSPDSEKLNNYIAYLHEKHGQEEVESQIVETQCLFL